MNTISNEEQWMLEMEKHLAQLPCEAQRAIHWLVANIGFVETLAHQQKIPEVTLHQFMADARERKDYTMLAMLLYLLLYTKGTAA